MGNKLEKLLAMRQFEPPSGDLAERIIATARVQSRKKRSNILVYLRNIFADILPNPSYALASVLVLGFVLGTSNYIDPAGEEYDISVSESAADLFYYEDYAI